MDDVLATDAGGEASEEAPGSRRSLAEALDQRFELFEAIVLAVAALLTAWAAFQATKWGGVQADYYSRASAARTDATAAATRAGQLNIVDVDTFTSWIAALGAEQRAGVDSGLSAEGAYSPQPGTESAFLYARFRPEFKTALDAWLATKPLSNPQATPTPFDLPDYHVAELEHAAQLETQAEGYTATARDANERGDDYVLMTILLASVLVLLGIGSKMDTFRARTFLFVTATMILVVAAVVLFTFPVDF